MRAYVVPAVMLAGIAWLTSGPSAQGLGSIAKREAERRQQVSGGKKYTNENLQPVPEAAPPPSAAPAGAAPTGSATAPAGTEAKDGATEAAGPAAGDVASDPARAGLKTAEEKRGEEFWRTKAGAVQAQIDKANARVDGLKKRLDDLEAQLANGAGTSHVQEREVTLKALEKAQSDAKSMREERNRLENRAKSEKVPLEWLR